MDTENIIVYITASNDEEAAKISKALVEAGLAACVNIVKNIRSIYRWQGKIEDDPEVLMIVKTRTGLFEALAAEVRKLHSYEVPEIIALPIVKGSEAYLNWLKAATDTGKKK